MAANPARRRFESEHRGNCLRGSSTARKQKLVWEAAAKQKASASLKAKATTDEAV